MRRRVVTLADRAASLRETLRRDAPNAGFDERAFEDGSMAWELRRPRARFALFVEVDPEEDSWHYVSIDSEWQIGSIADCDVPRLVTRVLCSDYFAPDASAEDRT